MTNNQKPPSASLSEHEKQWTPLSNEVDPKTSKATAMRLARKAMAEVSRTRKYRK